MNKEKVSIIIPTYNRENSLLKSVKSVLDQSYKNIEIIVVDDASVDNSEKIIKKIKDKRIKYIKLTENKGAANARNVGIKKSTGEYIAFQDSDDVFKHSKIEVQLKNLKQNKSDLDFCKICIHENENDILIPCENHINAINDNKIIDELCNGNFISTQAIIMKRDIALKFLFDATLPRFQDYDFILRMISSIKISYTDEVLVDLYRQENSISNNRDKLRKAISIMINKNYNLLDYQKKKLNNCFLFDYDRSLRLDMQDIEGKYNYYEIEYNKVKAENKNLKKINKELENKYFAIINSKRYKLLSKILKIFKR